MGFIKHGIKKALIHIRHEKYRKRVSDCRLSYDKWIKIQEQNLKINSLIPCKNIKCLTNDCYEKISDRKNVENEGNHSKMSNVKIP